MGNLAIALCFQGITVIHTALCYLCIPHKHPPQPTQARNWSKTNVLLNKWEFFRTRCFVSGLHKGQPLPTLGGGIHKQCAGGCAMLTLFAVMVLNVLVAQRREQWALPSEKRDTQGGGNFGTRLLRIRRKGDAHANSKQCWISESFCISSVSNVLNRHL